MLVDKKMKVVEKIKADGPDAYTDNVQALM